MVTEAQLLAEDWDAAGVCAWGQAQGAALAREVVRPDLCWFTSTGVVYGVCVTYDRGPGRNDIVPVVGEMFGQTPASASPDLLRTMIREMARRMMDTEAETLCGTGYGEVSAERVNPRNGHRRREWDTRAGTIELAVPKLRSGSYYPGWLLLRRRRAERTLASVVATSYLLGVSTRGADPQVTGYA